MEDTSCEDKCAFVKAGICEDCSSCPNYIESIWYKEGESIPKVVKDCAPKRNTLMLQELYNQMFALQQSQTEVRNETNRFNDFFDSAKRYIESAKNVELI